MQIAIIGCGITGAYLAWKLAKEHKVTVFEKKHTIGKAVCSGMVSERLWDFVPKNEDLVEHQINYAKIHFPKKTAFVRFRQKMLVINHANLDRYVAGLAVSAGAKIVHQNVDMPPQGFDRIIGADGALSTTRKLLKLEEPKFKQGLQFFIDEENNNDFVETWPVKNGFIWKIPRGSQTEYGIMADLKDAKQLLETFCNKHGIINSQLQAALIPLGLVTSDNEKVALCGDACGLSKPWSGGGIIWGLTAANILLADFPDFQKYGKDLKAKFGRKIWQTSMINSLGYFLGNNLPWLLPNQKEIDSDWLI